MRTLTLGVLGIVTALGQSSFEVASVKPSAPDGPGMFIRPLPGGGLRVSGANLKSLISLAYGVRGFQIIGGPGWIGTELFDIEARSSTSDAPDPTDETRMREEGRKAMERLKSLLSDRFQLTLRFESREQPVYALVVANGGPKLEVSTDPRSQIRRIDRGTIQGRATALGLLALNLSNELGRKVIDKTGLPGKYSFELKWDADGPTRFTALTEQLGLRLEGQKGLVDVIVIERAERPSRN